MDKRSLDGISPLYIIMLIVMLLTFFIIDERSAKDLKSVTALLYLAPFSVIAFLEKTKANKLYLALIYYFTIVSLYFGVCYLTFFFGGSKVLFKILPMLCAVPGLIWYSNVIKGGIDEEFEEEAAELQIKHRVTDRQKQYYTDLFSKIKNVVEKPLRNPLREAIWKDVASKTKDLESAKQTCIDYYLSTKRDLINDLSELRSLKSDIKADLQYLIDMGLIEDAYPHNYKENFLGK